MRRPALALLLATCLLFSIALPAFAHASLDKKQVPAGTEVALTLRVPIEIASDNQRIETLVPAEFEVVDCSGPDGWDCEVDETSASPDRIVVWTSEAGSADERFALTLRTPGEDAQGVYLFPTVQTYVDGTEASWIQQETGGDRPAPRMQVGDANAEIVNNDAPTPHATPTDSPTAAPTPTSEPTPEPSGVETSVPETPPADDGQRGLFTLEVVLVLLVLVVGGGLVLGFRRGRS